MDDKDFVPFIPRLIRSGPNADNEPNVTDTRASVNEKSTAELRALNPQQCEPQACEQQPNEPSGEALQAARGEALQAAPNEPEEDMSPIGSVFSIALEAAIQSSTRDAEIRCAAVRLACIATGRILRHAVAFDPQIVARFVDDAIVAARRDDAFVRVDCVEHATSSKRGRSFKQDERLDTGEVILDFPSGSLGATLEERAALAVRAAADA